MEIEDKRTVYGECTYHLVPREDEPSVCLMHDWIYLLQTEKVCQIVSVIYFKQKLKYLPLVPQKASLLF